MNPLKLLGDKMIWYDNFQNNWSIEKLVRKFIMAMCKNWYDNLQSGESVHQHAKRANYKIRWIQVNEIRLNTIGIRICNDLFGLSHNHRMIGCLFFFFGPKGIKLIVADYFLKVPLFVVIDDQGRSAFRPFVRPDLHFLWTSSSSTRSPSSTLSLSSKSLGQSRPTASKA